ncbi:MAG: protein phosphatase 2C domain-containing protein [Elusimicrobiota bacterium]|jgi:protein phosphatase|nr:protein phosphatase 2C domain-containing protein [Elusimicrobiota bacterium]
MKLEFYTKTHTGTVRNVNQDAYGVNKDGKFFLICDGMGGGSAGDFASKRAVEVILKCIDVLEEENIKNIFPNYQDLSIQNSKPIASIYLANRDLRRLIAKYPKLSVMGTTVVAAEFSNNSLLHIYHVGDSRIYRIRNNQITLLTKDHSKINELIEEGKISQAKVKETEMQSVVTRVLGTQNIVKVDYKICNVENNDVYIMCSDGLNSEIDDETIKQIVLKNNMVSVAKKLIEAANSAGGKDNSTVIAIKAIDNSHLKQKKIQHIPSKIVTFEDLLESQSLNEHKLLEKLEKTFSCKIPKKYRETNYCNYIIIFLLASAFLFILAFLYISFDNYKHESASKKIESLWEASDIGEIILDIKTVSPSIVKKLKIADENTKQSILQEILFEQNDNLIPLPNVKVLITSKNRHNKFIGFSTFVPLKVKLPCDSYSIDLYHPKYQASNMSTSLDIDIFRETKYKAIIMLPTEFANKESV